MYWQRWALALVSRFCDDTELPKWKRIIAQKGGGGREGRLCPPLHSTLTDLSLERGRGRWAAEIRKGSKNSAIVWRVFPNRANINNASRRKHTCPPLRSGTIFQIFTILINCVPKKYLKVKLSLLKINEFVILYCRLALCNFELQIHSVQTSLAAVNL